MFEKSPSADKLPALKQKLQSRQAKTHLYFIYSKMKTSI